jgi:hypothetical protein
MQWATSAQAHTVEALAPKNAPLRTLGPARRRQAHEGHLLTGQQCEGAQEPGQREERFHGEKAGHDDLERRLYTGQRAAQTPATSLRRSSVHLAGEVTATAGSEHRAAGIWAAGSGQRAAGIRQQTSVTSDIGR